MSVSMLVSKSNQNKWQQAFLKCNTARILSSFTIYIHMCCIDFSQVEVVSLDSENNGLVEVESSAGSRYKYLPFYRVCDSSSSKISWGWANNTLMMIFQV